MSKDLKTLLAIFVYNEGEKIGGVLEKVQQCQVDRLCDIFIMDDCSTDEGPSIYQKYPYSFLVHPSNRGVGSSLRDVIQYAFQKGYDILAVMAGNGKMNPAQVPGLLQPIYQEGFDYIQGSRFLPGGTSLNLPLFRYWMIKIFSFLVFFVTGFKGTDVTCGFRAYRLSIFDHQDFDISQEWLDGYEMEYYIHYKVIQNKFRIKEVPVSMEYPLSKKNYSKIRPFVGWWKMVRPWVYLTIGWKK